MFARRNWHFWNATADPREFSHNTWTTASTLVILIKVCLGPVDTFNKTHICIDWWGHGHPKVLICSLAVMCIHTVFLPHVWMWTHPDMCVFPSSFYACMLLSRLARAFCFVKTFFSSKSNFVAFICCCVPHVAADAYDPNAAKRAELKKTQSKVTASNPYLKATQGYVLAHIYICC